MRNLYNMWIIQIYNVNNVGLYKYNGNIYLHE